jgi:hypothetical protein
MTVVLQCYSVWAGGPVALEYFIRDVFASLLALQAHTVTLRMQHWPMNCSVTMLQRLGGWLLNISFVMCSHHCQHCKHTRSPSGCNIGPYSFGRPHWVFVVLPARWRVWVQWTLGAGCIRHLIPMGAMVRFGSSWSGRDLQSQMVGTTSLCVDVDLRL